MNEGWKGYRGAPAGGTIICNFDDIPEPGTLCCTLSGYPVLLVRRAGLVRAFVNACPHQFLPLNHRGERLLSADGQTLRCTNHGAGFDALTGQGTEGLGIGCKLDAIPVSLDETGAVRVVD